MNFTKHMMNERLDRAGFILSHVSLGHSVAEQLIQEPEKKDCVRVLTNTGIIIVYAANKEKVITIYLASVAQAKVFYPTGSRLPNGVYKAVKENARLLKLCQEMGL